MLCGGCVWSIMFLLPWFPWRAHPALHFVVSLSCYDTLYSFCAIAGGSLLTEMHVSDRQRIQILRVKTVVGMAAAFVVMQLGQYYFADKTAFRAYCVALTSLAAALYAVFYSLLQTRSASNLIARPRATSSTPSSLSVASITVLLKDFYHLRNFRYWLGMEMCLETQSNFNRHYLRIFLVHFAAGLWSPTTIASVIAGLPLLKQLIKLVVFSVMDRIGVYRLYHDSFVTKLVAAVWTLSAVHTLPHPSAFLVAFLLLNMVVTELPTGGFPIAMSNMHKELSLRRQQTGRGVVASSSAMFMGLNAVFCKPMDSLLPILAAMQLDAAGFQANKTTPAVSVAMTRLLVYPPLILSLLQLWSWRRYTLDATHVASIEQALSTPTGSRHDAKQVV
ncbi:hypothetical protein SPRG_00755 [Saprolegnia parasitica CBS 223.65]|uniref:Uncharacterized protein n=1 Tax=Saprolegnia parasitica (strain CBS 223.65) TaxID=695850 RepID=A0A067D7U4_SAPPC|nr:hypothetical protein SPRG_00755 [Saprolegnia parasitica CBS 223.65]KDO34691.1 hypothetical protein SPRG_00755 [Saprolegnia parasitica CBS 223.65]|eukprot:XP_012194363.1 hypothetical protein SPRG_00755 [Saprolegnia parasitica CBS 223.65]